MRPGRLDRILYVGPPNFEARKDIFRIRFSKMAIEDGTAVEDLAFLVRRNSKQTGLLVAYDSMGSQTEGCSGAEIASICQDAALTTMNEDLNAPFVRIFHGQRMPRPLIEFQVRKQHLLNAAKSVRRRITPNMISQFEAWRDQSGARSV